MEYLGTHDECVMYIGENVMALRANNRIETMKRSLATVGFIMFDTELSPLNFNRPQTRRRIYICAVRVSGARGVGKC